MAVRGKFGVATQRNSERMNPYSDGGRREIWLQSRQVSRDFGP